MAVQTQRQPVPDQDRENPAGPWLTNDPGSGESAFLFNSVKLIVEKVKKKARYFLQENWLKFEFCG